MTNTKSGIGKHCDVQGKVVLVTGANRGIGKAIVDSLIKHGAKKVYAAVRNLDTAQPLIEAYGDKIDPDRRANQPRQFRGANAEPGW